LSIRQKSEALSFTPFGRKEARSYRHSCWSN
jgi:hypothetical protein